MCARGSFDCREAEFLTRMLALGDDTTPISAEGAFAWPPWDLGTGLPERPPE
jgi:hypothetical protein